MITMEYQDLANLLDNTANQAPNSRTKTGQKQMKIQKFQALTLVIKLSLKH